jgi:hypothetical protein
LPDDRAMTVEPAALVTAPELAAAATDAPVSGVPREATVKLALLCGPGVLVFSLNAVVIMSF